MSVAFGDNPEARLHKTNKIKLYTYERSMYLTDTKDNECQQAMWIHSNKRAQSSGSNKL